MQGILQNVCKHTLWRDGHSTNQLANDSSALERFHPNSEPNDCTPSQPRLSIRIS